MNTICWAVFTSDLFYTGQFRCGNIKQYHMFVPTYHREPEAASADTPGGSCDPWLPPHPKEGHTCLSMIPGIQGK